MTGGTPFSIRLALSAVRVIARLVPRSQREDWLREWEAEILHSRIRFEETSGGVTLAEHAELLRRASGSLPDAAWVRRQFGPDADLVRDLKHGARRLARERGFAVASIGVLSLGLGAATALFAVADALILRPLPYPDSARLMVVGQTTGATTDLEPVAPANFLDWRERARSFDQFAAAIPFSYNTTVSGAEPEVFFAAQVTDGFFEAFALPPLFGRLLQPADFQPNAPAVCVLGERLWRARFGADPKVVGRTLVLSGKPHEVVGILPRGFELTTLSTAPGRRDLWTPHPAADHERRVRGSAWWAVVGRLRPDVPRAAAQAELDAISATLQTEHPRTNTNVRATLVGLREHETAAVRPALALLGASVAVLLAIVWANVVGLMLAQSVRRDREFAIRASLGAGRWRLLRLLLSDAVLVSAIGGALAFAVAHVATTAIVTASPANVPRIEDVSLAGTSVLFLIGLAGLTTLACGLPHAIRFSLTRPRFARSTAARSARSFGTFGTRRILVVAEVALAVVLLVSSGLVARSLARLSAVDPGFQPEGLASLQVFARPRGSVATFFEDSELRLRALPGVLAVGSVSRMPFMEANIDIRSPLRIQGANTSPEGQEPSVSLSSTTAGYFDVMKIRVVEGRSFTPDDRAGSTPVVIVNEALARRYLSDRALGRRVSLQWQGRPIDAEVIGVVGSVRQERLDGAPEPEAFLPHAQVPFASMSFVIRTAVPAATLIEPAKRAVWSVEPSQPFYRTATMEELIRKTTASRRLLSGVMSVFAVLALVLTASGLYGLVSVLASERTGEFGVRLALGASATDLARLVLGEGVALTAPGLGLGLVGALLAVGALRGLLFDLSPFDPVTFVAMGSMLALTALLACLGPARRALRVDPTVALRAE